MFKDTLTASFTAAVLMLSFGPQWGLSGQMLSQQGVVVAANEKKPGGGNQGNSGGNQGNSGGNQGNSGGTGGNQGNSGGTGGNQGNSGGAGGIIGGTTGGTTGGTVGGDAGSPSVVTEEGGASAEISQEQGIHGRGLEQHAAALDFVLQLNGLHDNQGHYYDFHHIGTHPVFFGTTSDEQQWETAVHNVTCSMFRYLGQLREAHPDLRPDYVEWITNRVAEALGEDVPQIQAALHGYPHQHAEARSALPMEMLDPCAPFGTEFSLPVSFQNETSPYVIVDASTDAALRFRLQTEDQKSVEIGEIFGRPIHLFVVRDDLRYFSNVHPELQADGAWSVAYAPPAPGTYWVYAQFQDVRGDRHVLRFSHTYAGDTGKYGFIPHVTQKTKAGPYTVMLETVQHQHGTFFALHIVDDENNAPLFDIFEGAIAHSIFISPTGEFTHVYSSPAGDHVTLEVPTLPAGMYRSFTTFYVRGKPLSVEFDWESQTK